MAWQLSRELERRVYAFTETGLNETQDHLDAGLERRYLTPLLHHELRTLANRASGASVNLVKYLDSCKRQWRDRFPK